MSLWDHDDLAVNIDLWDQLFEGSQRKTIVMDGANKKIIDSENICERPVLGKLIALPMRALSEFKYDKPWAAISITDPGFKQPKISEENRVDLLRLEFDDVELPRDSFIVISNEQALQIWNFVDQLWDKIDLLMVHCHAGISRSTAVCKAISSKYQPEFTDYFEQLYSPNKLVYDILSKASNHFEN